MHIDSMKIKIVISPGNTTKEVELEKGSTVNDLLKKINHKPDGIIVIKNNIPIPVDDVISEEQELKIIQVASGG